MRLNQETGLTRLRVKNIDDLLLLYPINQHPVVFGGKLGKFFFRLGC